MTNPVIQADNLIKIHKQGNLEVVALQGLDFAMGEGEFVSIVGTSGSGKSTLLTILAGFERPSAGRVVVADKDVVAPRTRDVALDGGDRCPREQRHHQCRARRDHAPAADHPSTPGR